MIVTRTPLRISFVGGGSDLPAFYRGEPGTVVSAAIDKYVTIVVNRKFDDSIRVAYSRTENVEEIADLQHDIVRETLRLVRPNKGIEIHSIADIPSGTGLGSSSAFTVGLLRALYALGHERRTETLAHIACQIEIECCKKAIGKQDQYAAAYGGLNLIRFLPDETVEIEPIKCDTAELSRHLLLLYTGQRRNGDAGQTIAQQRQDRDGVRTLVELASGFAGELQAGNWRGCGVILDMAWAIKRQWASSSTIDHLYLEARRLGAWGGKLCGAGGGGFLAFLAPPERHEAITQATGLRAVPVKVGVKGSEVVYESPAALQLF